MNRDSRKKVLVLSLAVALLSSCALDAVEGDSGHDRVASLEQRIIEGDPVSNATQAGLLKISSGALLCGGTLVGPTLVLTAKHCAQPGSFAFFTLDNGAAREGAPVASWREHPSEDIALGTLAWEIIMDNGQPAARGPYAWFGGDVNELRNSVLTCFGPGPTQYAATNGGNFGNPAAVYHVGYIPMTGAGWETGTANGLTGTTNGSGQATFSGDSGGACLRYTANGAQLVAVIASGDISGPRDRNGNGTIEPDEATAVQVMRFVALTGEIARWILPLDIPPIF